MQKFQTKLKELWEKVKGFFNKLNKKMRILLGVCLVVILAAAIVLFLQANKKEYAILCTGLNASDTSTVVKFLSDNGVADYQIQDNDTILVPKGREVQLQTQLVLSGNLNSGYLYPYYTNSIGLTSTSAEQERAWLVSVQQRLEAIIQGGFEGVREAHVTINPGTERLYVLQDSATPSTASVVITVNGSERLKDDVVKAIRDAVAHSVERLNIENISVSDQYGPYSDNSAIAQTNQATALKLQYEEQINNNIRSQVLQTLGPIYGYDNISVGVVSKVEVSRKTIDSTTYKQPDGSVIGGGLVVGDHLFWEVIRDGSEAEGGTVGTSTNSNLPIYPNLEDALNGDADYAGSQTDRDIVVDTTREQMDVLEGRLSDLRVTVSVNATSTNGNVMSVEELKESVATLVGIGAESVEAAQGKVFVTIKPFYEENPANPNGPGGFFLQNSWVLYAAIGGLVLFLVLLLVVILLARKSKKKKLARQRALEEEMAAAEAAAEAAAILAAAPPTGGADIMEVNTEKSMELRKSVRQFAQNNPEIAAQMVKAWLKGEDNGG